MALHTSSSAVELPTNRQSRADFYTADVHDPNYIPVLHGAGIQLDFGAPRFSAFPPGSGLMHDNTTAYTLNRSKSAHAPERVVMRAEADAGPVLPLALAALDPSERKDQKDKFHTQTPSDDEKRTHISDSTTTSDSTAAPSTVGTSDMLERQVYNLLGSEPPKADELVFPAVPNSARSSLSSIKRTAIPTSKYSKKPLPTVPTIPSSFSSQATSPINSPKPEYTLPMTDPSSSFSPFSPVAPAQMEAPVLAVRPSTLRLHSTKSTASERRSRALHSHPSDQPMPSRRNSKSDDAEEILQRQPVQSHAKSQRSMESIGVRSRSHSIYDSQQPTPAPTTPLPDLPAHAAKRPPTREREKSSSHATSVPQPTSVAASQLDSSSKPQASPQATNEHYELANFMTSTSTVVFRRFDDVHVRLLLQLQDEISALEGELQDIENSGHSQPDRGGRKVSIMRDLRKLLAEYDHLFANWSQMQAQKATPDSKQHLEQWLQNPGTSDGPLGISKEAKEDLRWLQESKDLSTVSLLPHDKSQFRSRPQSPQLPPQSPFRSTPPSTSRSENEKSPRSDVRADGGRRGGGFAALFGCASKRK